MAANSHIGLALVCICMLAAIHSHGQGSLLKRQVSIDIKDQPIEHALMLLSDKADFTFSYDASIFSEGKNVSVDQQNQSVQSILDQMLSKSLTYKVSGNHLILLKKPEESQRKNKYLIEGYAYHAQTQQPIEGMLVYEVASLVSSVTNAKGAFSLNVPAEFEQLGLSFNKSSAFDSVLILNPRDQQLKVFLNSNQIPQTEKLKALSLETIEPVESVPLVRQIVPAQSLKRTESSDLILSKFGQVSFVPGLGTNRKMSGLMENRFSLNVLIGYARAVTLLELGGLFNVISQNVSGVQIAGVGNLVGGDTDGVQIGGVFNHNRGSLRGTQIGGVSNMLIDTLRGVQISGVSNVMKGGMQGWQIAGVSNLTTKNVDGVQVAGVSNIAHGNVETAQMAGLINVSNNVDGFQLGGLANVSKGSVGGFQLSGILNKAKNVGAFQVGGLGNIASDTVSGIQLAGLFNYARMAERKQVSLFNFSDSSSATPIGVFSYVKNGFRTLQFSTNELIPGNLTFKTGVKSFYNIFTAGYGSWAGDRRWSFGYGFGFETELGKWFSNLEYTGHWVSEGDNFNKDLSLLNRLHLNFGPRSGNGISFSAGPTINVWLSEWKDPETGEYLTDLAPYTLTDTNDKVGSSLIQVWVGGQLAIGL